MNSIDYSSVLIGVLAIQGAVEEHVACFKKLGVNVCLIKLSCDMDGVDGIVLPGGESTAMAIVGEEYGLFPKLKDWVQSGQPIWGTCAGMILLSDYAIKQKDGGQSLIGGLDVHVCRNFFGPQINSCKIDIVIPQTSLGLDNSLMNTKPFPAIFIRAPAILKIGPTVIPLAEVKAKPHPSAKNEVLKLLLDNIDDTSNITTSSSTSSSLLDSEINVIVAAQQSNILATAFHPELTNDLRFHRYFLNMVKAYKTGASVESKH